jgi:Flp pilus assembly protein TadD
MQGKYDKALPYFRKATDLNPSNATAWKRQGLVLRLLNRNAEAEIAFAKAKELGLS